MTYRLGFRKEKISAEMPTPSHFTIFKGYDCYSALTAHYSFPCGGRP
jgi:hypothetical protein